VTFPKVKLSTLIALHVIAAGLLWLNVQESVLRNNALIVPLGWPNDAVMLYQEAYHQVRANSGFAPSWGEVDGAGLGANAICCLTILALVFAILEFKQLGFTRPARNTWWVLAAVLTVFCALNTISRSGNMTGLGFGLPFFVYAQVGWPGLLIGEYNLLLGNLFANIATGVWLLLGTYFLCQKVFAKRKPASTSASIC
jgi:hypothetical protein